MLTVLAFSSQFLRAADSPLLAPGAELPPLGANTLSGDAVSLPRDAQGHPAILVIGFSKAAAKTGRGWLDGCRCAASDRPTGNGLSCYDVRMLEDVPRFLRGTVERGMRSGLPVELQRQTLLVYSGNDAWRARVGATEDKISYVVGCDRAGRVRRIATGQFENAELKKMLDVIEAGPTKDE